MGISTSVTRSQQSAEAFISQQFSGSCNVTCQNIQSGVNVDIINSIVGGDINLTQKCSVDGSCSISSSSDATTDILFKAKNSSSAKNASYGIPNIDTSVSESRQNMKQTILQNTTEKCDMSSINQMSDVNILAANSKIGGSISIDQDGATKGSCQLANNITAAATATGMASNTAKSGKDKKGDKKSTISQLLSVVAVLGVLFFVAKMYTGNRDQGKITAAMKEVAMARAEAGCPGGAKPIVNHKTGKPIIDPKTLGPICPPVLTKSNGAPTVNINLGDLVDKLKK